MKIALRNVDVLLRLTTNLINFERTDVYSSELFIAQYDLKSYLQDVCDTFRSYAAFKHLDFTCDCNVEEGLEVWFDKENIHLNMVWFVFRCRRIRILGNWK